jgi:hypothetical protein
MLRSQTNCVRMLQTGDIALMRKSGLFSKLEWCGRREVHGRIGPEMDLEGDVHKTHES